jgi:hypothetical protein
LHLTNSLSCCPNTKVLKNKISENEQYVCESGRMEEGQVGKKQANSERRKEMHETVRKEAKTSK